MAKETPKAAGDKKAAKRKKTGKSRAKGKGDKAKMASGAAESEKAAARRKAGKNGAGAKATNGGASPHGAPDLGINRWSPKEQEKLTSYLQDVAQSSKNVFEDFVDKHAARGRRRSTIPTDPLNVSAAFLELFQAMSKDPGRAASRTYDLWQGYWKVWANSAHKMLGQDVAPVIEPTPGDRRFRHKAWNDSHVLDFLKQSYLLTSAWMQDTIAGTEGIDERARKRAGFYAKQFVDALSPSNFALTNPEVIEATIETKGENLLKGFKNLLEDLDRGDGSLAIKQADMEYFKVGENIATAPGKVVFQNEIMQLIQYEPATEQVHKRPLLIFPPWINKFYILDLQPENSFIRWATQQGRTVFLVSWVNPGPELANKTFTDYINEGVYAALDGVEQACGEREVDAIGYCIGGTLLSSALALMAKRGEDRIKSATFFAAQADFSEAGDLLIFIDDAQIKTIEQQMDASGGLLEGSAMANAFNMLRSDDLIWSFVVNNYLMGKDPKRFDLLFWNADSTRIPRALHTYYLREFYLHNRLSKGELEIEDEKLNLSDIKIPCYFQASETDHIAPYRSVFKGAKKFGGRTRFMLAGSGHIAGVINHPAAHKYRHWVNEALPDTVEEWRTHAEEIQGSWWMNWLNWLDHLQSGDMVPARDPARGGLKPLENAPGSYVNVKSYDEDAAA